MYCGVRSPRPRSWYTSGVRARQAARRFGECRDVIATTIAMDSNGVIVP
jgi:hypothetical protein